MLNQDYIVNVDLTVSPSGTLIPSSQLNVQNITQVDSFLTGPKGDAGAKGDTGAPGAAATVSVGTTTTGAAGSSASVSNSGTSSAAVFNFTVPQGANGVPGSQWYEGAGVPSTTHNNGDMYLNTTNGDVYQQAAGAWGSPIGNIKGPAATGGVTGPGSSTDKAIVRFNGTTGQTIQDSLQAKLLDSGLLHLGPDETEDPYSSARFAISDPNGALSDMRMTAYGGSSSSLVLTGVNGTPAIPTDTSSGQIIGALRFQRRNSATYSEVGHIYGFEDGQMDIVADTTLPASARILLTSDRGSSNEINIAAGNAIVGSNHAGGSVIIQTGEFDGTGAKGVITLQSIDAGGGAHLDLSGLTVGRNVVFPDAAGTLLLDTSTATVTNKNLTSGTNTFPTFNQNTTGSAATLTTGRTIGILTGDATSAGSSFNGSANNTNAVTLATVNSNVGTFTNATVTVNAKGLVTAVSSGSGASAITRNVSTITTAVTIGSTALTDYVVFVNSGGAPTLPTAVGNTNLYTIKNIHTTNKTIATTSSQTIDGSTTATITPNTSLNIVSDGSNWRIV